MIMRLDSLDVTFFKKHYKCNSGHVKYELKNSLSAPMVCSVAMVTHQLSFEKGSHVD